ncbi:MAG: hypothetical protein VW397_09125, partial [Candidatus Margulisiibacteriota bacterium]
HNLYGVGQIGLEDVSIYMAKSYPFPIDHVVFSLYSAEINDVLIHSQIHLSNLTASDFSHIKDANGNAIDTTELLPYLVDKSYLVDRDTFYRVSFNDWQETIVSEDQIISALNKAGLINLENQIDVDALRDLDGVPNEIKELYRDIPDSDFIMDALMTDLNLRANPNALHLTQAASNQEELGAGFQMVNTSMVSMARKNFMLMNMTRRVYMTLVCSYTQFFEKIAGKLSKDSTQSSHYGDWQNSLLESHMGIAERQLSSIHNDTVSMVSRINELHKHRLNLVKLSDPLLRGLDMTSTWSSVVGALLMLMPTPITHMLGILITMASSILSLAESWRGYQLEMELDQEMTEQFSMYDLKASVETFFNANLRVSSDASFTTNAGESIDPQLAPRSVVDYNNAHLYINPDDPQVQELLRNDVFPNGIPSDTTQIIEDIHSFMSRETQYIADSGADDWACVGEVAQRKSGDCEDLVNLEHSLILAAFQSLDDPALNIANHAAYVTVDDVSLGHVYMTVDVDGETMVLDPSLSAGTLVPYEAYQATYNVKDVFTYDHTQTNVLNPKALGLETAGLGDVFNDVGSWFSDLFDDVIPDDFFNLFLPDFSDASIFDNMSLMHLMKPLFLRI